jgi:hypothetical protein
MNEHLLGNPGLVKPVTFKKHEPPLNLPRGNIFRRMLTAKAIALIHKVRLEDVVEAMWPDDRELGLAIKATSAPAMTTVPSWAGVLGQIILADTVDALSAASGGAELLRDSLLLSWNGADAIGVPSMVASANNAGFVKEGDPIPVRQFSATDVFLNPYKIASIAVLTREMIESSNAEALIGDTLVKSAGLALDAQLFGSSGVSSSAPAGLLFGVATLPPSSNTDPFGAVFEDITALVGAVSVVGGKGPYYIVGNAANVIGMDMRFDVYPGSPDNSLKGVISGAVGANLIAVAAQAVAAALSPAPDLETATTGALVMDTAPVTPNTTLPTKSLFQTESVALKMRWPVSWVLRDPRGVAWTTPTWK